VVSLVPPVGTGRREEGGHGEDGGSLNEAARAVTMVGGLGGCLDSAETESHGGSSAKKRRRQRGGRPRTSSATGVSTVEKDQCARVMVDP
jgi:hypothetical protein